MSDRHPLRDAPNPLDNIGQSFLRYLGEIEATLKEVHHAAFDNGFSPARRPEMAPAYLQATAMLIAAGQLRDGMREVGCAVLELASAVREAPARAAGAAERADGWPAGWPVPPTLS